MGISGSDAALVFALSGEARAGGTRSGYKPVGVTYPLYAISGVARSGATRVGTHTPKVCISIAGTERGWGRTSTAMSVEDLSITDVIDSTPSRATFTVRGTKPTEGSEVIIRLGSINNSSRLFAGQILSVTQSGRPGALAWACACIDYTWLLDRRRVNKRYAAQAANTIAADLISSYTSGFTTNRVQTGLATIDEISFTDQAVTGALTQLAKRAGCSWYCDYNKDIHFYEDDTALITDPTPLTGYHTSLMAIDATTDLSQVATRVHVEGGGGAALTLVDSGETILPVEEAVWYNAAGGTVASGPQAITYTGVNLGGGGGLVGTGAAPSAAPVAALASGSGIESGVHSYAASFVTGSGESLPGPLATLTVGAVAAPVDAPTAGTPTIGTGPNPGTHLYAVTYVTSAGETTASPTVSKATTLTADPSTAPTAVRATGTGVDSGNHDYAVTFVTSIGETLPSPISSQVTCGPVVSGQINAPSSAVNAADPTIGTGPDPGTHQYAYTYVTASGETEPSATTAKATSVTTAPAGALTIGGVSLGTGAEDGTHDYQVTFVTSIGETSVGPTSDAATSSSSYVSAPSSAPTVANSSDSASATTTWNIGDSIYVKVAYVNSNGTTTASAASNTVTAVEANGGRARLLYVSNLPVSGDSTVSAKRIYLNVNGSWIGYWEIAAAAEIGSYGSSPEAGSPPGSNTAIKYYRSISLTGIPTGDSNVISRNIYRRFNATGTFKLLTTIANNTATTYTDTTANASLGAAAPSSSTAYLQRIALSGITTGPSGTISRKVYRTVAGGTTLKLLTTISNNTATTFNDTVVDADLGATAPTSNTTGTTTNYNQVSLSAIPKGDANVASRKVYRRSDGVTLKLLTTIADNTTTTMTDTAANATLGAAAPNSSTAYVQRIPLTSIPTGGALVTSRKVYRTVAGGAQLKLLTTIADNTTTTFNDTVTDASLGVNVPTSNTAAANQAALSSIPVGPSGVTSRKVYRTVAGGSTLKLLTTLADNTTTTYADSTADASLTTTAPSSDASGLAQPSGQVLAGATTLPVAGTGGFPTAGWAVIGNGAQVIRYTGKTISSLTGVPASGAGAITASVAYNSTVTAAPQLTGIPASGTGAILYDIAKGDEVNLRVTVNDTAAQAALAALIGGDGVQEATLRDNRLSETEATARGEAHLSLVKDPAVSLTYRVRDQNSRAGRDVYVDLLAPVSVSGTYRIQQVTITGFTSNVFPFYDVQASSTRYSFEDVLRRATEETR